MNAIVNNSKQTTMRTVVNFLKSSAYLSRGYAQTVGDYNIVWVKPKKKTKAEKLLADRSGDQGLKLDVKPSDFCLKYDESPELKDASDLVKKMFTLQFQPCKQRHFVERAKAVDLVKRHELDAKSPEAQIAALTSRIHYLQEYVVANPYDSSTRVALKEKIERRRKFLRCLRLADYKRFEWVLEKLNLIYKPLPEPPFQVTRKDSFRRLTKNHCDTIMQDKLDKYKSELKELQKEFYKEKAEKLAFIRKEELECNVEPTVSEEDVTCAREKAKEYEV
ncbi:28S ribosomal protein S15, mitochondrial [Pseudomyrmex gracilis]|uniref:28S ribosomal protein S15, mitochondrial n=1 Tax=Pseudomyrmex gracilis TaxID=219809 RepID=UPI000994BD79|nr:28S ribosomal protein S15, mitochondrial [Pseudomyrmex gracilis]